MVNSTHQTKPTLGNRYQLLESIGTGGMAVVYTAQDLMLERKVAIKLLRQRYSRDDKFREQFHLEAKAAANLSHQNIVTVYDFGLDKNRLYIVMEYIPGQNLKAIINQKGRFSSAEAILLISQACFGIGYAHRAGLVHCDIKPHNMLVTTNQRLKVTDFGISRLLSSILPEEQHDIVWGSPLYFSPEQASGEPPSPASDVYSLGIILYEMLTGHLPFDSQDPEELAHMHREYLPTPPSIYNPEIQTTLENIILKVLSKNPCERYNNADQLGRILLVYNRQFESSVIESAIKAQKEPDVLSQIVDNGNISSVQSIQSTPRFKNQGNEAEKNAWEYDWITIGLGLLAVFMIGGLIPFWLYIWLSLRMP